MRPLLFLHGLTIDGRDAAVLSRALPSYSVRAVPLPGHEAPPVDDWSPRAIASSLVAELPSETCVLVGHSWGAAIAVHLASIVPARISALVLLEGGWFDRVDLPRRGAPTNPHHAAALEALFATRSSMAWPVMAQEKLPTLAVVGATDDAERKAELLAKFVARVPHAETRTFERIGHDLLRDGPDEVGAAVGAWCQSCEFVGV